MVAVFESPKCEPKKVKYPDIWIRSDILSIPIEFLLNRNLEITIHNSDIVIIVAQNNFLMTPRNPSRNCFEITFREQCIKKSLKNYQQY